MAKHLPSWAPYLGYVGIALFVALPLLTALCLWQTVATRERGDEPLARSWADATRSFGSMTLGSWVLAVAGWYGTRWLLDYIANVRAR